MGRTLLPAVALMAAIAVTACAPAPVVSQRVPDTATYEAGTAAPSGPPTTPAAAPDAEPAATACHAEAEALSPEEQVGQLLMVGVSTEGLDTATSDAIRISKAGSVVLLGDSSVPRTRISALAASVGTLGSADLPLLVSVDQEGGQVQRLQGEGFTRIPSAVDQGQMNPTALRSQVEQWAQELRHSGVRWDLAPVADVVAPDMVDRNDPIGRLQRHYGTDPDAVTAAIVPFIEGMRSGGVATSVKHFPGLGAVVENTDFAGARDTTTTTDDPGLEAFRAAIDAGASSVMISSAIFERIDPEQEAVFSEAVITDLLRGDLGYEGVVISDDLGAAAAVAQVDPGERAVRFVGAGGDVVINANPATATAMTSALLDASEDPAFAAHVTDAAARVLALKASLGLVECG